MRGRVKNLKNVYRTPSNIAKCAFEILALDKSINDYYKKSHYLNKDFLHDVNFVLEDGELKIDDFDDFEKLKEIINKLPENEEKIILTYTKKSKEAIEKFIKAPNLKVMTMASVKGLEAQNVIIHNFGKFLINNSSKEKDVFYRQVYVLLTRAQDRIFLSISNKDEIINNPKTEKIYNILKSYENYKEPDNNINNENTSSLKLAKIKPVLNMQSLKEGAELIVTGAELFGVIAGLFSL
jgi:superfamily I DNA/RNA helicase